MGGRARVAGAALRRRRLRAAARRQLAPLRLPAAGAAQQFLAAGSQGWGRRAWRGPGGPLSCCSTAPSWPYHPGSALIPKPLALAASGCAPDPEHSRFRYLILFSMSSFVTSFRVGDSVEGSIYVSASLGTYPITTSFFLVFPNYLIIRNITGSWLLACALGNDVLGSSEPRSSALRPSTSCRRLQCRPPKRSCPSCGMRNEP